MTAFFVVADLLRQSPFATPLFLARMLVEQSVPSLTDTNMVGMIAGASPGAQVGAVTILLIAAYALAGLFSAELANLFNFSCNVRRGLIMGALAGAFLWLSAEYFGAWYLRSGGLINLDVFTVGNALGGGVIGWYLDLSMREAEQD